MVARGEAARGVSCGAGRMARLSPSAVRGARHAATTSSCRGRRCDICAPQPSLCDSISNGTLPLRLFHELLHERRGGDFPFRGRHGVLTHRVPPGKHARPRKPLGVQAQHVGVLGVRIPSSRTQDVNGSCRTSGHSNNLGRLQVSRQEEIRCIAFANSNLDAGAVSLLEAVHLRAGWHQIRVVDHHIRRRKLHVPSAHGVKSEKGNVPLVFAEALPASLGPADAG